MKRIRPVTMLAAAIGMMIVAGVPVAAASRDVATLTGIARDLAGAALSGVEVFVLGDGGETAAVATITDERGRFSVSDLPQRLYQVAGFKEGYFVSLGRVNTVLSSSVDLLFRPLPRPGETGADSIATDRAWALRLPARSILREEGAEDELRPADTGTSAARWPAFLATLDGSLAQSFGFGTPGVGVNRDPGMQGSETRLHLSSPLGERAGLDLIGGRARTDAGDAGRVGLAARASSDLLVQVTYDPTDDSRVQVQSFFAGRDVADRSWGWDARWSTRLDASTHLDVGVDYRDASSSLPSGATAATPDTRALQASGSFESIAAKSHRLQLAFAAGQGVPSQAIESGGFRSLTRGDPRAPAWSVRLNAQDSWSLTGRTSLVYGVGCLGPLDEGAGAPVLMPRVGGVLSRDRVKAHLVVSYLAGASGGDVPAAQPLGYDAQAEVSLPEGFRVSGSASYAPALPDPGIANDDVSRQPIFLTDGNASVRAAGIGIERSTPFGSSFARYSVGTADGSLSALPAARAPVHLLGDERLSFRSAVGGVRFARTGTRIEASWRSVIEDQTLRSDGALARRSLQTSVVQELPQARESDLAWKLLLLYRSDRASHAEPSTILDFMEEPAFGREIRAGVSMAF